MMTKDKQPYVGSVIQEFVGQIESLATSLPLTMLVIQGAHRTAHKSHDEFVEKHCKEEIRDGDAPEAAEPEPDATSATPPTIN